MICYRNKSKQQTLDVFQEKGSDDLIVYIKSGKIRCKVKCSFDTEKLHYINLIEIVNIQKNN